MASAELAAGRLEAEAGAVPHEEGAVDGTEVDLAIMTIVDDDLLRVRVL
jgi:hypothetical protein